ncbi:MULTISPECIES: SDR family oxidoreductase [Halomonas]|uniref:SDR family oxidoreductase n=1 Tax=Halomonas TaxID=2745 RepID=UPI001C95B6E7|nr:MULTISPECIES: SDR family oxidoreductase [Halomonas]MBY6207478.1 SDR family oxidoreductase [Halomonas sp. DP3Y7-2]MBY6228287.1 SDR family oxidoreductase [Halomonas sp. DP3Y7-1]MCA0916352.1 SDR family oxidoreductase [Halomonas denitrificans]
MSDSYLKDKVIVLTGASSGIGAATAERLAQEGARLVLVARNSGKLISIQEQITDNGGTAIWMTANVGDASEMQQVADKAVAEYGQVDILINNAGVMLFSDWVDTALDDWHTMVNTNIEGYLHSIAAILPLLLKNGGGTILNMSSVAGIHPGPSSGVYSATKSFVRSISENLRMELAEKGIRVGMVSPGVIDTGWADKVNDEKGKKVAKELNEQAISPEKVADAIAYALNQPHNVAISDVVIHPVSQTW